MAKDQISREIFDAMMQEMIGNYSGDRYDEPRRSGPSRSTPRSQSYRYEEDYRDNGRYHREPPLRSPRDDYRSRAPESRRSSYPGPHRREYDEDLHHAYSDRRRSGSPSRSRDRYYPEHRDHDLSYSRSRDASWSEEPDYYQDHAPYRDRGMVSPRERGGGYSQRGWGPSPREDPRGPRSRGPSQGPRPRGSSQGLPVRGSGPPPRGRGAFPTRGRGTTFVARGRGGFPSRGRPLTQRGRGGRQGFTRGGTAGEKAPVREQSLKALMEKADAVSNCESQVIRWAGFLDVSDTEFTPKNPAHSTLETDTCINTLTSFRCFFKPELRYFCFLAVRTLNHSALKKPKIDGDFFQLLMDKGAVTDKFSFSKIINPLDKHLTIFQTYLLKSAHPLLLACNEHELNLKKAGEDAAAATSSEETSAIEKSISLCRKGLVLLGQTFAVVTAFRQEKILEAAGLLDAAPKPSDYPNLDDSLLFGKEYVARLKAWLEESKHKIKVKSDQVVPQKGLKPEPKVKETLDSLLENAIHVWKESEAMREKEAELKKEAEKKTEKAKETEPKKEEDGDEKEVAAEVKEEEKEEDKSDTDKEKEMEVETEKEPEKEKPDFWFLFDEESQEFKYYQQKLAEIQKLKRDAAEAKLKAEKQKLKAAQLAAAEKAAAELKAAEKVAAEKRAAEKAAAKEAAEKAAAEKKAAQKAAAEKASTEKSEKTEKAAKEPAVKKTIAKTVTPAKQKKQKKAATKALTGILKKTKAATSTDSNDSQEVDAKTKETAENLARFIVQMGTGAEDFNMESLTSNPEFWFLNEEESAAFKFYETKLTEFREAPEKTESSESVKLDVESKDSESEKSPQKTKDSKSKDKSDVSEAQEGDAQVSESQDNEESEERTSQDQMECDATESAGSDGASQSATSTPARSPLTRKRGRPMRGGRGGPAKRACPAEEPKVEEPNRVGNEKPSGRPALRKKQTKQKEAELSAEDDGIKVGDASGDEGDE
ncbi:SURP and G-patch domain-containing protein 2-like [Pleurodeles waltl]|uniref:SURP and G-patch domain-containing protein 2-like n=1 Tax=Pleurodeles waltl TaxID=8319 RepID=UPI0037096B4E